MKNFERDIQVALNLFRSKNFNKAELACIKLLKIYPKNIWLYNLLGITLTEQNKIDEAINCYEKGLKIDPNYSMIYNNLGSIHQKRKNYIKAEAYYKKSIELDNKIPEPQNNLGNFYRTINEDEKAINAYKKAVELKPSFFPGYYNLGITYKNNGNIVKAKKYLEESIKLNKDLYPAHRALSEIIKYKHNNEHLKLLNKIFNDEKNLNKKELAFALGKAYEDIKDYDKSFKFYINGNELHRKSIVYIQKKEINEFKEIKKTFNKKLFKNYCKSGNKDKKVIFIVGMPRSGTSLVEQILSSHKNVFGGGELNIIPNIINKHFTNEKKEFLLSNINNKKESYLKDIGNEYIETIKKISLNKNIITDKLPINFKWIGLIKLILPNSKIIHCNRNPKDTCLSIFKNYFVSNDLKFGYNLNEIASYYEMYLKIMNHWRKTIPEFINEFSYENLISKPDLEIRNLLIKCDLSWDKNCLKFYENKRSVKTVSDTQVRKKIYKTSINSWKNYEKFIKAFFKSLPN